MEDKEKIKGEFKKLYQDIDECVTSLIRARKLHDGAAVAKAYQGMEKLMVATQQDISWLLDNLQEEAVSEDLEKELDRWYEHDIGLYKTREQFKEMIYHFLEIQKKQMIKQAVDAKACAVYPLKTCNEVHYSVQYPIGVLPQKDGDKVKVVIIKEE